MSKLLDLLKAAAGEISLSSRLGKWAQAVSQLESTDAAAVAVLQAAVTVLQGKVLPDGTVTGQSLTWSEAVSSAWAPSNISPLYVPVMPWTPFIALANAAASIGRAVQMGPGSWTADVPGVLASDASILGGPDVRIVSTMLPTGTQANSVFIAAPVASGNNGTLNGSAVLGAYTLSYAVAAGVAPVAGDIIKISKTNSAQTFVVQQVAGGGPYTLTLDRPVKLQFTNGDPIEVLLSRPTAIRIDGRGMQLSGTGDRFVELSCAYDCHISGLRVDAVNGNMSDMAMSFDIGSLKCDFTDCAVDAPGSGAQYYGIALEGAESCATRNCTVNRAKEYGQAIIDGIECTIVGGHCNAGAATDFASGAFVLGTGASLGCVDCVLDDCHSDGGAGGCVIGLSQRSKVTNSGFNYAAATGVSCTGGAVSGASFMNVSAKGCAVGFNGGAGNTGTVVVNLDVSYATTEFLTTASDLDIIGLVAKKTANSMSPAIGVTAAVNVRMRDLQYSSTVADNVLGLSAAARWEIDGAMLALGNNSIGFYGTGGAGTFVARNVKMSGTVGCTAANLTNTTLRHTECDFTSPATLFTLGAGGYVNVGQLISGGAGAAQNVVWPDLKGTDHVTWTRIANGGTPGIMPLSVNTPATGFAATFAAGDTSTYEWRVD